MANPRDESEKLSVNHTAPNDSDSETEVFHDARYPADEEAVRLTHRLLEI